VRKPSFTVRSLEFLKSHNSPWQPPPPSSSSVPLLCRAIALPPATVAAPPEANYSSSAAPRVAPKLAATLAPLCWPSPNTSRRSAVRSSCSLSAAAARRRCRSAGAHASPPDRSPLLLPPSGLLPRVPRRPVSARAPPGRHAAPSTARSS
jgi:hypothetical protein